MKICHQGGNELKRRKKLYPSKNGGSCSRFGWRGRLGCEPKCFSVWEHKTIHLPSPPGWQTRFFPNFDHCHWFLRSEFSIWLEEELHLQPPNLKTVGGHWVSTVFAFRG